MKIRSHILLLLALPLSIAATPLPQSGPVPEKKPAADGAPATPPPAPSADAEGLEMPDPNKANPSPQPGDDQPAPAAEPDAKVPTPEPKPAGKDQPSSATGNDGDAQSAGEEDEEPASEAPETGTPQEEEPKEGDKAETPPPPPPPPVEKEDPEALKACLADLAALGTKFETAARIDEGEGCGIDQPMEVAEILPGIDSGGAQMRCETARALGHWLKDTVNPALDIAMPGRKITGLATGSTYACRLRNGASEGKISEHARGNAIDIAAFRLDDGSEITMKPRHEDGTMEGAFQRTATAGACLHFSTVLSPGSDAAHQDHLHLDVLERESGYRYCR